MITTLTCGCGENHHTEGTIAYRAAYVFPDGRIIVDASLFPTAEQARSEANARWQNVEEKAARG